MIWIFPAVSLIAVFGYWLWNEKLRRDCDAKMKQASGFLESAKYRQALTLFESAFDIASRITMGQGDRRIWCALNSAISLTRAGEFEAAYQAATAAFMLADRQPRAEYSLPLYTLMADLSEKNGHPQRAVGLRQVVVAQLRESRPKDSLELAEQVGKLGKALASTGLPEHASIALTEAMEITKAHVEAGAELQKTYADYLIELAPMLESQGQTEQAEQLLKKALAIGQSLFGEKDARLVGALKSLGSLYCNLSRFEEAFLLFEEAYRIQVRAYGNSDAGAGLILTAYATCLRKAGRLDTAEDTAARAVKLLEMNHHPGLASGLGALGAVLMAEGDYSRAVDAFEKADAASIAGDVMQSPLETADRLESHADALEHLNRALEAESLRSGASSIRSTLAAVPPAEQLFSAKLDDFVQSPEWPHKVVESEK